MKKKREKEEDWLITQNQQRPQEQRRDPRNNEGLNEAVTCLTSWPLATCTGLAKRFGRFNSSFTATTTSVQRITFTLYSLITRILSERRITRCSFWPMPHAYILAFKIFIIPIFFLYIRAPVSVSANGAMEWILQY